MPSDPAIPHILVIATGGTIAGAKDEGARARYRSGGISVAALVECAGPAQEVSITTDEICSLGSPDIDLGIWRLLADRIEAAISRDGVDGIVITHGTDTLEETAFLLDKIVQSEVPVVMTGAVRPSDSPDADGPDNLRDAIRLASSPHARGWGVIVALGGDIHAADGVRKHALNDLKPFSAAPHKPVGTIARDGVVIMSRRSGCKRRYALPVGPLPDVVIIHIHADLHIRVLDAMLGTSPRGIVLAGVGNGNAPMPVLRRLRAFVGHGGHVVRSSRIPGVCVERNIEIDDDEAGFVSARGFAPAQARLLLQLNLAGGMEAPSEIQAAFDEAAHIIINEVELE